MDVDIVLVLAATAVMFVIGAAWYMGLFAKPWGEMFGFDKLSKAKQKEAQKEMGPFLIGQLVMTFLTALLLAKMIDLIPDYSAYTLAIILWIGLVVPTQYGAVVFGGTESKWIVRKMSIMASASLANLLAAAWVIGLIQ